MVCFLYNFVKKIQQQPSICLVEDANSVNFIEWNSFKSICNTSVEVFSGLSCSFAKNNLKYSEIEQY